MFVRPIDPERKIPLRTGWAHVEPRFRACWAVMVEQPKHNPPGELDSGADDTLSSMVVAKEKKGKGKGNCLVVVAVFLRSLVSTVAILDGKHLRAG